MSSSERIEASPSGCDLPADHQLTRRFARLTALNILANLTVPLVGLVDAAMLGHLEDIRFLAGVALGAVVFDILFWTFGFLRMATTGLTAQAVGRRDPAEIESLLRRSLILASGAGLALLALQQPLADLAFGMLSGSPETEQAGRAYYEARIWGAPAALLNFVFLGWFLGREESRIALYMTLVANGVNIALDYVFIMRLDWNAAGAGWATMISQYLMLVVAFGFYWPRRHRVTGGASLFAMAKWKGMFGLQRDIMIRTLFLVSTFAVFTDLSARFGDEILAANTLLLRLVTFAAFFIDGAAFAVESLAGVLHGAGATQALRRLVRLGLLCGVALAAVFVGGIGLFPGAVFATLTSHDSVIALASELRFWLIPVLLVGSAAYIYDGLFLGLTEGRLLRNAMVASVLLGFVPLAWLALRTHDLNMLWAALACFMVFRVGALGWAGRYLTSANVST